MPDGRSSAQCVLFTSLIPVIGDVAGIILVYRVRFSEYYLDKMNDHDIFVPQMKAYLNFVMFTRLVTIGLRAYGTWALWQSLKKCDTNPEEANNSIDMARYMIFGIWIADALSIIFIPCIILETALLTCCLKEYQNGLRTAISQRGVMMSSSGNQMMMPSNGYGPPRMWPANSNVVYPAPPSNVVDGKTGAQSVLITYLILYLFDGYVIVTVLVKLVGLRNPEEEDDDEDSFIQNRTKFVRRFYYFLLFTQLVTIGLRAYGTGALWQSLRKCDTNPEEATKSFDMARYMIFGICIADALSFIFIPGIILESAFLICCLNEYQNGLRTAISQREMMGGWMVMTPSGNPMMMTPSGS